MFVLADTIGRIFRQAKEEGKRTAPAEAESGIAY
jgi:hypothetical protein